MKNQSRAGFMLLELLITISLFGGLLSVFAFSLSSTEEDRAQQEHQDVTRAAAAKVLGQIREALSQTQVASGFPVTFPGNTIGTTFPALAHGAANMNALSPPSREIAFLTAEDADDDGWPDLTASGSIAWTTDPSAITFTGNPNGTNSLRLVGASGTGRVISRSIRSVVIDDSASSGFAIPLDALSVTVFFDRDPSRADLPPDSLQTTILLSKDDLLP